MLASFERPRRIIKELQEQFEVRLTYEGLRHYDAARNTELDEELKQLFACTRAEFLRQAHDEPLNHLAVRQRERWHLLEEVERNPALKREILNDAARDEGGLFTSRTKAEAEVVPPIPTNLAHASAEELARVVSHFPIQLVPRDIAQFMIERRIVPPERGLELDPPLICSPDPIEPR